MCQDLFFPLGRQTDSMLGVGPTQQRTWEAAQREGGYSSRERGPGQGLRWEKGPPGAGTQTWLRRVSRSASLLLGVGSRDARDLSATLFSESHGSFCQRPSSARNEQGA